MPNQKPPVILAIDCRAGYAPLNNVGNSNRYTPLIFGTTPLLLSVDWTPGGAWWANPLSRTSMEHILFELQPNFSRQRAERWVHETGFVKRVRHNEILRKLTETLNTKGIDEFFDSAWCDAVKIVILDIRCFQPGRTDFAERVFLGQDLNDPLFKNATHYRYQDPHYQDGLRPVWADELKAARAFLADQRRQALAPAIGKLALDAVTAEEIKTRPIWELDLQTRYRGRLAACGYATIGALVEADEQELLNHIGISHATVRAVRKALAKVGQSLKGEVPEAEA